MLDFLKLLRRLALRPGFGLRQCTVFAVESAFEPLDDLISVGMIGELLEWARLDPVLMRLADPSRTYLCGHSRV